MPISKYYGGHGAEVMRDMKKRYGAEKGERVFYATANKRGQTPEDNGKRKARSKASRGSRMGGMAVGMKE
jgi:hypothetical protein